MHLIKCKALSVGGEGHQNTSPVDLMGMRQKNKRRTNFLQSVHIERFKGKGIANNFLLERVIKYVRRYEIFKEILNSFYNVYIYIV